MSDSKSIADSLAGGQVWDAVSALSAFTEPDFLRLASEIVDRVGDRGDVLDTMEALLYPPPFPHRATTADRARLREASLMLGGALAVTLVSDDWRDLLVAVRELSKDASWRVEAMCVRAVAKIATRSWKESRPVWEEAVLEGEGETAACVLRGIAQSDAPASDVLRVFSSVISDLRRHVRRSLGAKALPDLGRREPQAVYTQLWDWTRMEDESARWHVAQALATTLGGVYPEQAVDMMTILAADERPSVWRAAAAALVQLAQRRPSYALPIIGRWRDDPERSPCARLVLEALAKR